MRDLNIKTIRRTFYHNRISDIDSYKHIAFIYTVYNSTCFTATTYILCRVSIINITDAGGRKKTEFVSDEVVEKDETKLERDVCQLRI